MSNDRPRILVVDDEEAILETMSFTFEDDYEVHTSNDPRRALDVLDRDGPFAAVLTDQRMPDMSGVEFVAEVWRRHPATVRMILTGFSDMDAIIQAINDGHVYAYITKPWEPDQLKQVMKQAVEHHHLAVENERLLGDLSQANRFLEAVIDELDSGAIALDSEDVIQAANRPVREYFDLSEDPRGHCFKDLLEAKGLVAVRDALPAEAEDDDVTYHEVDVDNHRFRVTARKLTSGGDELGRVVLFREISHEPLRRRFDELVDGWLASSESLRGEFEAGRDQLAELSESVQKSTIQSPGMTQLADRISRARTSLENWLAVDDALAQEDFPDVQVLQDRMRLAGARWPLGEQVPERVSRLAQRVVDYYETGEQTRETTL
ncbi:MAG: response regulator [Myxococcota bacterium]